MGQHGEQSVQAALRRGAARTAVAIVFTAGLTLSSLTQVASGSPTSVANVKVLGWGFDQPAGMVVDGQDLFVANSGDNTVTEMALPTMTLVRVIQGQEYQFSAPSAVAVYGQFLWVLSEKTVTSGAATGTSEGVLTEVNAATGQLVQVLSGSYYGMDGAVAMTINGPDLFVVDANANQLTEVDASTGQLVQLVNSPYYAFAEPRAITALGPDVVVANDASGAGGTLTEFDAATGALVQLIGGAQYKFREPEALAAYGPDIFVLSPGVGEALNGSITEVDTGVPAAAASTTTAPTTTAPTSATPTTTTTTSSTTTTASSPSSTTTSSTTSTTSAGSTTTTAGPPPAASVVRVLSGSLYGLGQTSTATVIGNYLYVANVLGAAANTSTSSFGGEFGAGSVERIDAQTGLVTGTDSGGVCNVDLPYGVVGWGDETLVSNIGNSTISELGTSSGQCVGDTLGSPYQLDRPAAMVVADGHLFVGGETFGSLLATASLSSLVLGISSSEQLTEMNPSTGSLTRVLAGNNYNFGTIGEFAEAGPYLFAANAAMASVTELDARTGQQVRVITLGKPGTVSPTALAASGSDLFVAEINRTDVASVREIDVATGHTQQTISGKQYRFGTALSLAVDGPDLFVDTINDNSSSGAASSVLTEVDVATGALVRVISTRHSNEAIDVVSDGPYLFEVDLGSISLKGSSISYGSGTLVQINAKTGELIRVISGARYDMGGASAAVVLGDDLYVADSSSNAVTEIDAATGALVGVLSGSQYDFAGPDGEATWHNHLYVANGLGQSVTDIQFGP